MHIMLFQITDHKYVSYVTQAKIFLCAAIMFSFKQLQDIKTRSAENKFMMWAFPFAVKNRVEELNDSKKTAMNVIMCIRDMT